MENLAGTFLSARRNNSARIDAVREPLLITVVTFFWQDPARKSRGYSFNADHVRILKSMVDRHLTLPHKFVCVTDEEIEGVDTIPMDWTTHVSNTVYARLVMRRPGFFPQDLGDRIFSLDLDVVLTGNIDHIVGRKEDCVFWHNPNFPLPKRAFYQSSIQLFTAGARSELWSKFNAKTLTIRDGAHMGKSINWRFGGAEQAWISEMLDWDEAFWDARDGIYGAGRLSDNGELPGNACIVSFPGSREPSQPEVQEKHPWILEHYR